MEPSPAVLLLDLPPAALAGIDLLSFTTTAPFRGIKDLPPGPHFVFTAPHATLAVRHGAWIYVHDNITSSGPQLVVKKWDGSAETLVAERDSAALLAQAANLGSIWRTGLSPYRQHAGDSLTAEPSDSAWSILASRISAQYLSRVFGSDDPAAWHSSSYSDVATQTDGLQQSFDTDPPLRFLAIDLRRPWPAGATGQERTRAALDYSWYLSDIGTRNALPDSSEDIILAEMQFTFLLALTLNNMSALEQWRTILRLTLGCRAAPQSHPDFFIAALDLLTVQLSRLGDSQSDQPSNAVAPNPTAKPLEARSEAELLAYDLPIRHSSRQNTHSNTPQSRTVTASSSTDADLAALFLDTDSDPSDPLATNRSFLHTLLRSFASTDLLPPDLRRALSRVEALLFDIFGWTFDGNSDGADDDDEDDEGGDYAPAVVELSQAQMDELGIEGTVVGVEGRGKRDEVMMSRTAMREGGVSRVVVESDEDDEVEDKEEEGEEEWDDTVDVEELDARF